MTHSLCLKNALYLGKPMDVHVRAGRIEKFVSAGSAEISSDVPVHDAAGAILFPSFIDAHVHLREPGYEYKEDIRSGLEAAAYGGFGAVMPMANTKPVNDNAAVTRLMLDKAARHWPNGPRIFPVGAATVGLEGAELAPMAELAAAGCVAISNDGKGVSSAEMFRRCMEYAANYGLIVIDHCEDATLAKGAHMNEGKTSTALGIKGQSVVAEAAQVARDILLAEYLGIPVHIAHVSCAQSVELLAWAKSRGVPVTAETCPHYLLLDDTALMGYEPNAKVNPPLRTPKDVAAVRAAVKSGVIDMLVTDHAPHAAHEKEVPLDEAPNGISGLDTAVTLTYALIREGALDEADGIRLWCEAPARTFKLPRNGFEAGDPADFFLFDPQIVWTPGPQTMHSKSANTPFLGRELRGRVCAHWIGGVRVA